jgi:hypothetical protein
VAIRGARHRTRTRTHGDGDNDMSYVEIPFKKVLPPKAPPRKVLLRIGLKGRLRLLTCSGAYEIELDGKQVLAPTDEKAALARFDDLQNPKTETPTESKGAAPEPEKASGTHPCPECGTDVSNERLTLLGTELCPKCTPQGSKVLGVLDYSHKTGGVLMLVSNRKHFEMMKRPINQQR